LRNTGSLLRGKMHQRAFRKKHVSGTGSEDGQRFLHQHTRKFESWEQLVAVNRNPLCRNALPEKQ
jgi:hypothetical protein